MNKKIIISVIIIFTIIGSLLFVYLKDHKNVTETYVFSNDWLDKHNIYVYGTPSLDSLKIVNAIGVTFSVYYSGLNDYDKNYVDELHRNGFKVSSNFPTIQANIVDNQSLRETAKCIDINGNPLGFFGDQYAICSDNYLWQEFLKNRIKEHIDGKIDAIHIDEIGTNDECFCDDSIAAFNSYLSSHYSAAQLHDFFGIDDINSFNYRLYLLEKGAKSIWDDPNQKLLSEYFKFLYLSRVSFIHELIQYARDYAGRDILFSGNTYGLRPDQQIYIPYLDFVVFEMPTGSLPDGKHFTIYLLGEALSSSKPIIGFPDIFVLANISSDDWWLWRHWLAEAYACGGSFLIPYNSYTLGGGAYNVPFDKLSAYTDFIFSHKNYYENVSRVSKVALLYDLHSTLTNQAKWRAWAAWYNFIKTGQELQEAHILFDIIYKGDNEFVNKSITLNDLEKYSIVIIPNYYDLDVTTESLLKQYSQKGGYIVTVNDTLDNSDLIAKIKNTGLDLGLETNAPSNLSIIVYKKDGPLLLHFINYDYNNQTHDFIPKNQTDVTLTIPDNIILTGKNLRLLTPDTNEKTINYTLQENKIKFTIPDIYEYLIASFE